MVLNLAIQWDAQDITNNNARARFSCVVSVVSAVMFAVLYRGALYAGGLPPLAPSWRNSLPNTYKNINKLPSLGSWAMPRTPRRRVEPLFTLVEFFYNCTM